jgi:hypothetical protein
LARLDTTAPCRTLAEVIGADWTVAIATTPTTWATVRTFMRLTHRRVRVLLVVNERKSRSESEATTDPCEKTCRQLSDDVVGKPFLQE